MNKEYTQEELDDHYSLWPTHLTCQHCDDDRAVDGEISIQDCPACEQTCCDQCYEEFHCGAACEPDARIA